MRRNKRTREKRKRGGCLKTLGIGFVSLMLLSSLGGGGSTDNTTSTQNFATTTTDNETEELSSEVEESIQAEESLAEEREAKEEEERLAKEKEEEERLAREAEERWQEKLDNARTDVTYDNLMRTPDDYFGEIVQYSGTVLQTITGDGIVQQRVALYDDYDKIVLIEYAEELPETRLLDNDYITFRGLAFGTIKYETVLGSELEIPLILAESINLE